MIAVGGSKGEISLLDLRTYNVVRTIPAAHRFFFFFITLKLKVE